MGPRRAISNGDSHCRSATPARFRPLRPREDLFHHAKSVEERQEEPHKPVHWGSPQPPHAAFFLCFTFHLHFHFLPAVRSTIPSDMASATADLSAIARIKFTPSKITPHAKSVQDADHPNGQ